jgi:hypothetical protein
MCHVESFADLRGARGEAWGPVPKLDVAGSSPVARSTEIVELLCGIVVELRVGPDHFFLGFHAGSHGRGAHGWRKTQCPQGAPFQGERRRQEIYGRGRPSRNA